MILLRALPALLLSTACLAQDLQVSDLGTCALESGEVLKECKLAWRDFRPDASDAPILVFPTWYGGSTGDLVQSGNIGPGLLADTEKYRVIAIDAFANGVSSSPSNSAGQAADAGFPDITIGDMVAAQHRLLTEVVGLTRVHAVMGVSMGGMQTFEWMARFPGFADRYVPIEGTPWPGPQDLLLWGGWVDTLGDYDGSPESLQETREDFGRLMAMTLWTPDYLARTLTPEAVPGFLQGFTPQWEPGAVYDHRAQALAMLTQAVPRERLPDTPPRALVVVSRTDMVVSPGPSLELAKQASWETLVLEGDCGHLATTATCQGASLTQAVHVFLAAP